MDKTIDKEHKKKHNITTTGVGQPVKDMPGMDELDSFQDLIGEHQRGLHAELLLLEHKQVVEGGP